MLCMLLAPRLWPSPTRTLDETLRLPLSSVIVIIIIDSRGLIELVWAKCKAKASSYHCWGCVKVAPLPTLIVLPLQAWSTHPVLGQSLGYPAVQTKTASPLRFLTPHWPGAGLRPVLEATFELNQTDLQLWRRNITTLTQLTTTGTKSDNEREICMAVYNGESMKVYDIKYTKMIQ